MFFQNFWNFIRFDYPSTNNTLTELKIVEYFSHIIQIIVCDNRKTSYWGLSFDYFFWFSIHLTCFHCGYHIMLDNPLTIISNKKSCKRKLYFQIKTLREHNVTRKRV